MRIVILGAGGHAQVIADTLMRAQAAGTAWELVGFLDDDPALVGQQRLGLRILGKLSCYFKVVLNTGCTVDHHNTIGSHAHIAPGAHLGGDVKIGEGALIGIGAVVMPQRRVGAWCTVGAGAVVTRDLPDQVVAIGAPARIIRTQG